MMVTGIQHRPVHFAPRQTAPTQSGIGGRQISQMIITTQMVFFGHVHVVSGLFAYAKWNGLCRFHLGF